ncbi:NAD(P)-dependent oxidoreductase [Limibacillus sp. MBR-115]|jgi:nucleoside-diphosphate-sugar epimerase|uniref:NAD-dependent epimerase/dehydratase family protein n=1 Tax=Limibacillus sp. MBR-115 TaxID=3156465 RepID=UPI0033967EDA
MSIMITGGTGFIGLNLVETLLARGEHVVVVALDEVPAAARAVFRRLPGKLTEARMDVRETGALTELMRAHAVHALFPFAAITSGRQRESEFPERVVEINLLAFIGQLRAARDAKVGRVVAPASGAVYGESYLDREVVDETSTPCLPVDIYGATKFAAERTALRLSDLWHIEVIIARIGGTFGPWEHDTGLRDFITPHWIMAVQALSGEVAILPYNIPACSWTYSRDVASGLVCLLDTRVLPHRVFNVASGLPWGPKILLWPEQLATLYPAFRWQQTADAVEVNVKLPDTVDRARMDVSRLKALGWSAEYGPQRAYEDYALWIARMPEALGC